MATSKRRINISISDSINDAITLLAERDNVPQATKASDLLRVALEIEEDQVWDSFVCIRDTKNAKYLSHENAWK